MKKSNIKYFFGFPECKKNNIYMDFARRVYARYPWINTSKLFNQDLFESETMWMISEDTQEFTSVESKEIQRLIMESGEELDIKPRSKDEIRCDDIDEEIKKLESKISSLLDEKKKLKHKNIPNPDDHIVCVTSIGQCVIGREYIVIDAYKLSSGELQLKLISIGGKYYITVTMKNFYEYFVVDRFEDERPV